ncbi:DUF4062 domain-containing protein [Actinoplanes sp. NPDC049681]|uniref:DUF4062 domain-containing protein n=1 Tax=Actinoplanes sp. NPDC049681 TaxID=3363905 RepID=UPI0037BDB70B
MSHEQFAPRRYLGVVVSSTFRFLQQHRAVLIKAVEGQGLHAVAMEQDAALPATTVVDASLQKVRDAAAYVGIVSHRYGEIPESERNPERLSLTELEFREARRLDRPMLIFIMGDDHEVKLGALERDPEKVRKLEAFRESVKQATSASPEECVYAEFNSLSEFAVAATQSVAELRRYLDTRPPTGPAPAPSAAGVPAGQADGIPVAPAFYAEPPYIGSHAFVGRAAQLQTLRDWAAPAEAHPIMLIEAIGGTGKSMLTWEWTTGYAGAARPDWAGQFWYSFYEKGAVMADFCRRALAYMTGRPLAELHKTKQRELSELLLRHLQARPWLLVLDGLERVLVAYHRYDAAQVADEQAGGSDEVAHRDPRDAIRPDDDELLRRLAAASPSKILVTSRLVPRILLNRANQPIPGVLHERLPGLRPADAEGLLRACGVRGDSPLMQAYLQRHCDCHPLVTGIVAGLVNDYLPDRGNFDAWATDPRHGGELDLAELDLIQKRNHILEAALVALPDTSRQLLSTLALLSEAADYPTLSALNPHLPPEPEIEPVAPPEEEFLWPLLSEEERRAQQDRHAAQLGRRDRSLEAHAAWQRLRPGADAHLAETVRDLERRGLLQYDRQVGRYDLHPVIRGIAAGRLRPDERDRFGQRVVDHFGRQEHPYDQADSLEDLRDGLTVVRTLLRMGRLRDAYRAYKDNLSQALVYNLEASGEVLGLLRPFFGSDWTSPARNLPGRAFSAVASDVSTAFSQMGETAQALEVDVAALKVDVAAKHRKFVQVGLGNIAADLHDLNRTAKAYYWRRRAIALAERGFDEEYLYCARLDFFDDLSEFGQWDAAASLWRTLEGMVRPRSSLLYQRGDAEAYYARYLFYRGGLTEHHLAVAARECATGHNRFTIRKVLSLRGRWLLSRGEWESAAESFHEAVRMAHEVGVSDVAAETWLAVARARHGEPAAREVAERLAGVRAPAHLPLAELWQAVGDRERARVHALAAYREAWADGEPYAYRHDLDQAAALLTVLGGEPPRLPAYDPARDRPLPWEEEVIDELDQLDATNGAWDADLDLDPHQSYFGDD